MTQSRRYTVNPPTHISSVPFIPARCSTCLHTLRAEDEPGQQINILFPAIYLRVSLDPILPNETSKVVAGCPGYKSAYPEIGKNHGSYWEPLLENDSLMLPSHPEPDPSMPLIQWQTMACLGPMLGFLSSQVHLYAFTFYFLPCWYSDLWVLSLDHDFCPKSSLS